MAKRGDISLKMSLDEIKSLVLASIAIGFAVSYNDWGIGKQFILSVGLINLILASLICAFTLWLRTNIQKRAAKSELTTVDFSASPTNLVYAFALAVLTAGSFVFAAPGRPKVQSVTLLRPGFREPHLSPFRVSRIVSAGTVVSLILIFIAKVWLTYGGGILATYLLKTNVWMAVIALIPLPIEGLAAAYQQRSGISHTIEVIAPKFEGEQIFFGSRPLWFFLAVAAVMLSGLVKTGLTATTSLILSAAIAFAAAILWIYYVDFTGHKK